MKKIIMLSLFAAAMFAGHNAMAADMKIAVVDAQYVLSETDQAKATLEDLQSQNLAESKKFAAIEEELTKRRNGLFSKKDILSEEKYLAEESALRRDIRQAQAEAQEASEALDRKSFKVRREIGLEIQAVIKEFAEDKGYQAVLNKSTMLFASDAIDISGEVLKRVNKRLSK